MHLIAPVNNREKTYQQFGGRNAFPPCDLRNEINYCLFHITRDTTGGGRTFAVLCFSFFIRLGLCDDALSVFRVVGVILGLPAGLLLPEPALALVAFPIPATHGLALFLGVGVRHDWYQSNP